MRETGFNNKDMYLLYINLRMIRDPVDLTQARSFPCAKFIDHAQAMCHFVRIIHLNENLDISG